MTTNKEVGFATGAGLITRDQLAAGLQNMVQSIPQVGGEFQYLKMDKGTGEWVYGAQETLVDPASLWAVNPASLAHGWVCWDSDAGGPPIEEVMVLFYQPLPSLTSLPPVGTGVKGNQLKYQKQFSVQMACVADPNGDENDNDVGTQAEYKQSSVGAAKAFAALTTVVLARVQKGEDAIVPIIRLRNDRYKHDTYGWIQNPIFDIVEWRTMDDSTPPATADEEQADAGATDEEARLAAEYEANKAAADTPRRRARR